DRRDDALRMTDAQRGALADRERSVSAVDAAAQRRRGGQADRAGHGERFVHALLVDDSRDDVDVAAIDRIAGERAARARRADERDLETRSLAARLAALGKEIAACRLAQLLDLVPELRHRLDPVGQLGTVEPP